MGPCPPGKQLLECAFATSVYTLAWLQPTNELMPLGAESFSATVSGFSGGGYFAAQTAVANSDIFQGVGVYAGGPYAANVLDKNVGNVTKNIIVAQEKESK